MSRQRYVYPTNEVPHKWAHATQDSARNPQGNLSFSGAVIRSYRTDIAQIYRRKVKGALFEKDNPACNLVLISEHTYSCTTSKQLGLIRRAVSHLPSITVPFPCIGRYGAGMHTAAGAHALNIEYLAKRAADQLKSAQRAMQSSTVEWRRNVARAAVENAGRYLAFFGMRRKPPVFPEQEWIAAAARAARIENPDLASADKRERASAARKAMTAARDEYKSAQRVSMAAARQAADFYPNMAERTDWRLGDAFGIAHHSYRMNGDVMLRVDGEQIETSQGARIPVAHAGRLWRAIEAVRASGVPYEHNGHSIHAGDYRIDRIDVDGTLHAGCHVIPHSELRSMARQLGLAS